MANDGKLDVPEEMRKFAETSVEQASKAFEDMMRATTGALANAESSTRALGDGANQMNQATLEYMQKNVSANFEFAAKLARAKDLSEIAALQQAYMQSQLDTAREEARRLGELAKQVGEKVTSKDS